MGPADGPQLVVASVGVRFGEVEVLASVDLEVHAGETVAIVGPSGSGKSTLLNVIGGLVVPTSGSVRFAGREVSALSANALAEFRNRSIGFVFQAHHLLPQCTALENVLVPTLVDPDRQRRAAAAVRARELLDHVGLGARLHHRPASLSGGECQRVAVVRALINRPPLLLADEPTGSLDAHAADELGELLLALNARESVALITVTHSLRLAARMSKDLYPRGGAAAVVSCGGRGLIGLVLRGLRHHWRTSIGVMLGATCAAAVLVGALAVGDSVRISLREQALRRIGRADAVLLTMERFFPAGLADRLDATEPVAPVLHLQGIARDPGNVAARAGIVNVYGVDTEFFGYSVTGRRRAPPQPGKVFLNERLARQLALDVGATVLLRIDKTGLHAAGHGDDYRRGDRGSSPSRSRGHPDGSRVRPLRPAGQPGAALQRLRCSVVVASSG